MKFQILGVCAVFLAGHVAPPAKASQATGRVMRVHVRASDGLHFVDIEGSRSTKPACATNGYFMIRDEKSDAGKAQYAMLMAAYLADRAVTIDGANTCVRWSDGEDILGVTYAR